MKTSFEIRIFGDGVLVDVHLGTLVDPKIGCSHKKIESSSTIPGVIADHGVAFEDDLVVEARVVVIRIDPQRGAATVVQRGVAGDHVVECLDRLGAGPVGVGENAGALAQKKSGRRAIVRDRVRRDHNLGR